MAQAQRKLTLIVIGDSPRSCRARRRLADAVESAGASMREVNEVDAFADPTLARRYNLSTVPALVLEGPDLRDGHRILQGDLSNSDHLNTIVQAWVAPQKNSPALSGSKASNECNTMFGIESELTKSPVLRELYEYWDRLRGGRPYIRWEEIDPVEIPRKALPYVIVAELLPDGDFYYRLTGTKVDALIGVVPQGKRLSELPLDRCEELKEDFRSVLETVEPQLLSFPIRTAADRYPETTRLVLPVASASGRIDMIFGAVDYGASEEQDTWYRLSTA